MKKIENSIPFPIENKVEGKIIIYGAGRYGEIARAALEQLEQQDFIYDDERYQVIIGIVARKNDEKNRK